MGQVHGKGFEVSSCYHAFLLNTLNWFKPISLSKEHNSILYLSRESSNYLSNYCFLAGIPEQANVTWSKVIGNDWVQACTYWSYKLIRLIGRTGKNVGCKITEFPLQKNMNLPGYRYTYHVHGIYVKKTGYERSLSDPDVQSESTNKCIECRQNKL